MTANGPNVNPSDRSPAGILSSIRLIICLMGDARVSPWLKLMVPATLLYLVFPLDFMPDFLVGPGQLDDLGVILLGLWLFMKLAPEHVVREYTNPQPAVDVTYRVVPNQPPNGTPPAPNALPEPGGAKDTPPDQ
jgi:uncharacterized membrane protein YkvA (DUF1232 family)